MKQKLAEWITRYGIAEALGTTTALVSANLVFRITHNATYTAYAASTSETIVYYATITIKDVMHHIERRKANNLPFEIAIAAKITRNLFLEFGPAEILDTLLLRPFLMFVFPTLVGNLSLGIFLGKISSDILFYVPTIISYELRKKHLKK